MSNAVHPLIAIFSQTHSVSVYILNDCYLLLRQVITLICQPVDFMLQGGGVSIGVGFF